MHRALPPVQSSVPREGLTSPATWLLLPVRDAPSGECSLPDLLGAWVGVEPRVWVWRQGKPCRVEDRALNSGRVALLCQPRDQHVTPGEWHSGMGLCFPVCKMVIGLEILYDSCLLEGSVLLVITSYSSSTYCKLSPGLGYAVGKSRLCPQEDSSLRKADPEPLQ